LNKSLNTKEEEEDGRVVAEAAAVEEAGKA
jgi:hypothetical protein